MREPHPFLNPQGAAGSSRLRKARNTRIEFTMLLRQPACKKAGEIRGHPGVPPLYWLIPNRIKGIRPFLGALKCTLGPWLRNFFLAFRPEQRPRGERRTGGTWLPHFCPGNILLSFRIIPCVRRWLETKGLQQICLTGSALRQGTSLLLPRIKPISFKIPANGLLRLNTKADHRDAFSGIAGTEYSFPKLPDEFIVVLEGIPLGVCIYVNTNAEMVGIDASCAEAFDPKGGPASFKYAPYRFTRTKDARI